MDLSGVVGCCAQLKLMICLFLLTPGWPVPSRARTVAISRYPRLGRSECSWSGQPLRGSLFQPRTPMLRLQKGSSPSLLSSSGWLYSRMGRVGHRPESVRQRLLSWTTLPSTKLRELRLEAVPQDRTCIRGRGLLCHVLCGILVPQSGIGPGPSALKAPIPLGHQGTPRMCMFQMLSLKSKGAEVSNE